MKKSLALGLIVMGAATACDYDKPPARNVPNGPTFELEHVRVEETTATLGFARGVLRRSQTVESFRISRNPVTIAQFRECVEAGACAPPSADSVCASRGDKPLDRANELDGNDDLPITCVGLERAVQFCRWHGGVLPTLAQWLIAARGTDPRRFAWRDGDDATCVEHPRGVPSMATVALQSGGAIGPDVPALQNLRQRVDTRDMLQAVSDNKSRSAPSTRIDEPAASCNSGIAIGLRPQQASPSGLQDVLLTHAELLRTTREAFLPACGSANSACVVTGVGPAAIEAVHPIVDAKSERTIPYGFRCVAATEVTP